MSAALPFAISPEAEAHIRATLRSPPRLGLLGLEPGLTLALGYESQQRRFEGEYFLVCYEAPEVWLRQGHKVRRLMIVEEKFWVHCDIIEALQGKTLTVMPNPGDQLFPELLVAA